jgi:ubiquinone/menaquinone biosynthesis C-methylase UbiE
LRNRKGSKTMAHKFNPKEFWKLESPERKKILPPVETLKRLGLKENDKFIDIGCGIGYFTIPAIEIVGPGGRVYGLDTSTEMLEELKRRLPTYCLENVELIKTREYELGLEKCSATFAFMSTVLHEVDDKERILRNVNEILIQKGRIAIIEWEKKNSSLGPPKEHRIDKEYVKRILQFSGYELLKMLSIDSEFYAIVGEKK